MSRPPEPRLPLEPLMALVRASTRIDLIRSILGDRQMGWQDVKLTSVNAAVERAATGKGLTPMMADRFACALGYHPAEVWGDDWWRSCEAWEVVA